METSPIDTLLAEAGLAAEKESRGTASTWRVTVQAGGEARLVTLLFPTRQGSLLVACKLTSPRLRGVPIDRLPPGVMRAMLRLQSERGGACVVELGEGAYAACAIHRGPTIAASVVRLLTHQAALLASKIDAAVEELPDEGSGTPRQN